MRTPFISVVVPVYNAAPWLSAALASLCGQTFTDFEAVLVEAQAAGLPCFVSDTVDKTVDFGGNMQFLPLGQPDAWADAVCGSPLARAQDALERTRDAGYDIRTTAAKLQQFYLTEYEHAPAR